MWINDQWCLSRRDRMISQRVTAHSVPDGTCRTSAAKRLHRTAQGFSPGSCVARIRPERGSRGASLDCWRFIRPPRRTSGATFRARLLPPDPGLKPWAVLSSRFAAKPDRPLPGKNLPTLVHRIDPTAPRSSRTRTSTNAINGLRRSASKDNS